MKSLALIGMGLVALLPASAGADERGSFVTLDREGTENAVGLEVSAIAPNEGPGVDLSTREDLWARYVSSSGVGAYAQVALAQLFAGGNHATAFSNVELGGLYVKRIEGLGDLTLRLGVVLPTAPNDDFTHLAANLYGAFARLQDLPLVVPDGVWLRPAIGLRFGDRSLFAQLSAGADIPIDSTMDDVIIHLDAGVGTTLGPIALAVDLASVTTTAAIGTFNHDLGASIRYAKGNLQPFVAYVLPFQVTEDNQPHILGHVVTAGVQGIF